jgi:hypothetical protein
MSVTSLIRPSVDFQPGFARVRARAIADVLTEFALGALSVSHGLALGVRNRTATTRKFGIPVVVPSSRGHYDWTVPNTPTNAAVIDIRFGCEVPYYPETASPQPASTFVIR